MPDAVHSESFAGWSRWREVGVPPSSVQPRPTVVSVATASPSAESADRWSPSRADIERVAQSVGTDLERVLDEIELLHAELAGTRRTLEAIGDSMPPPKEYRRWELGLQQLETAYQAASQELGRLSETDSWRQITKVWESLRRLTLHVNDEIGRGGADITRDWYDHFREMVVKAVTIIGDLSLQLAARLEQEGSPAVVAVRALQAESREVAKSAGSSLFVPAATADRVGVWAPGSWQPNADHATENPWFDSPQPGRSVPGRVASSGARLPLRAVRDGRAEPTRPRRAAVPPPVVSPVPARARPR